MTYPIATLEQIELYREHGWLVVENAIPDADLDELARRCERIIEEKETLANDWAWDAKESKDQRSFRIVQGSPAKVWPQIAEQQFRKWLTAFGSALMNLEMEFWYDQFLAKPPAKSAPTYWHQDEGYWGRDLLDKGMTCWIPLHDVDVRNGCMHFIDRGHREGVLTHRRVEGMLSDIITCDVDESRVIACPIARGSVTFHHSKTPHMTPANTSDAWRKAISNHLQALGTGGEGHHYPWRVFVNQRTGEQRPSGKS